MMSAERMDVADLAGILSRGPAVILDVRSPAEYAHGHIPGAVNLPLLNDDERKAVGITYKEKGQQDAVTLGFDLVGGKFADYIRTARDHARSGELIVYCARGGMRSGIMGWLLETGGLKPSILEGGYKSWRNWCIRRFEASYPLIVLCGKTGTGKTECLNELTKMGEAVIDLEALAVHRGSSFGSLGLPTQPTQEHFENQLALRCEEVRNAARIWIEDESRFIGKLRVPDAFFHLMCKASRTEIVRSTETRIQRIIQEYGVFAKEELIDRTKALQKRMGAEQVRDAVAALEHNDFTQWAAILLRYYDKTYDFARIKSTDEFAVEWIGQLEPDDSDLHSGLSRLINALNECREI